MVFLLIGLVFMGQPGNYQGSVFGEFTTEEECVYFREDLKKRKDISSALCVGYVNEG